MSKRSCTEPPTRPARQRATDGLEARQTPTRTRSRNPGAGGRGPLRAAPNRLERREWGRPCRPSFLRSVAGRDQLTTPYESGFPGHTAHGENQVGVPTLSPPGGREPSCLHDRSRRRAVSPRRAVIGHLRQSIRRPKSAYLRRKIRRPTGSTFQKRSVVHGLIHWLRWSRAVREEPVNRRGLRFGYSLQSAPRERHRTIRCELGRWWQVHPQ